MNEDTPTLPRILRYKERIYEILEVAAPGDLASRIINLFIIGLVLLNVGALGLEQFAFMAAYSRYLRGFELFSVAFFSLEYLLRLWSCTSAEQYQHPVSGRMRYAFRPQMLIDLVAVLPFYLPLLVPFDLRGVRVLRLVRLGRLFKLTRYLQQPPPDEKIITGLIQQSREQLAQIHQNLAGQRDRDLARVRSLIDATVDQIRPMQQTLLVQSRRQQQKDPSWGAARQALFQHIDQLEKGLNTEASLRQVSDIVQESYQTSVTLFNAMPKWASVEIELGWKNRKSYTRVPMQKICNHHFRTLANQWQAVYGQFSHICTDETRKKLESVRSAVVFVLDREERRQPSLADSDQNLQVGLNRALNRLRELDDPTQAAWENLLWRLEEAQTIRLAHVGVDVGRYGSPLFYVGRAGRWLRQRLGQGLEWMRDARARIIPILVQWVKLLSGRVMQVARPLLEWIGLIKPTRLEVLQALDEARLDSTAHKVPADYREHFSFAPLRDETLFVGFTEELAAIDQAIQRWEQKRDASFVVHGQRGSGKTTLLNVAQQRLFDADQPVLRHAIDAKITTTEELVALLADLLGLPQVDSFDALANSLLKGPRRAVLLEGAHNLFMRRVDGLGAIRHLCWLIARTNHNVLWGLCMGKYAYNYLNKVLPLERLFHFEIGIQTWKPQEMRQLILLRHHQSGYSLHYAFDESLEKTIRRRVQYWRSPDEPAVQEALEQIFFERLVQVCGENIIVGLHYWLRALQPITADRFKVMPMEELDLDMIRQFSMDQSFILVAILQHDNLMADEIAQILDTDLIQTRLELEIMVNQNILELNLETRRFRINPVALNPVTEMLESRNLYS